MSAYQQLKELRRAFAGWPGLVARSYLWKRWRLPDRDLVVRTRAGTTIHAPLRHNIGSLYTAFEVFAFGAYGDDWDDLGGAPFIIDIGANLGAFTLWLAERYPALEGIAFEPDPEAFEYLERNLRTGPSAVQARRTAVGAQTGTAELHRTGFGDGTSSLLTASVVSDFTEHVTVPTVSFDDLMDEIDRPVSVLKLDCEGAEYDIVLGSSEESWRLVQRVTLEYHPVPGKTVDDLRQRFEALGYRVSGQRGFAPELGMMWLHRVSN